MTFSWPIYQYLSFTLVFSCGFTPLYLKTMLKVESFGQWTCSWQVSWHSPTNWTVRKRILYTISSSLALSGLTRPLGRWFLLISTFSSQLNSPLTIFMGLESMSIRPSAMTPTGGPGLSSQEMLFPMEWVITFRFSLFQTSMTLQLKYKFLGKFLRNILTTLKNWGCQASKRM